MSANPYFKKTGSGFYLYQNGSRTPAPDPQVEALIRDKAAERSIAATKQQALTEVRGIAIDVGRAVVEKLIGTTADDRRLSTAVDGVLARQLH